MARYNPEHALEQQLRMMATRLRDEANHLVGLAEELADRSGRREAMDDGGPYMDRLDKELRKRMARPIYRPEY